MNSLEKPRRVVDLTQAQQRVIAAAKAIVDAVDAVEWAGTWSPKYFALREAVKELQALESDI